MPAEVVPYSLSLHTKSADEVLSNVFPHWASQGEPLVTKMESTPPSNAVTKVRPTATGRIVNKCG
jgi:hypothetical protein